MSKPKAKRAKPNRRHGAVMEKPAQKRTASKRATQVEEILNLPPGLIASQYEFCLHYLANGFNAAAAYRSVHPDVTDASAKTQGYRTLTLVDVRAYLASKVGDRWKAVQMSGEEALGRIALDARSDVTLLLSENGTLLPPSQWPADIINSIESIDLSTGKVKLVGKLQARRTVLEVTGKLRTTADAVDALAEAIKADLAAYDKTQKG